MPRLAVDTDATNTLNQRLEDPSPLAQRFASSPVAEPMSTDVSPLRRQRDARTLSPVALLNPRERKFPTETTIEEIGQPQRSKRQAPSKATVLTSFTSSSTRPPPSSTADTTPQQGFITHHDGDEEEEEDTGTIPLNYNNTSELRTPPRPNRTLDSPSTIRPSRSPTRATSVPLSPVYRSALVEGSEDGLASPHRVTSSMAKRSAKTRSGRKVPLLPLPSEYSMSPTKSVKGSKQLLIPEEVLEEGGDVDDEDDEPPGLEPNPIGATQSMPELRESPERRTGPFLKFLPLILESEKAKRTQQQHKPSASAGARLATLTEHSAEQDTESSSMSLGSREIREYAKMRLDKDVIERREFKLTQAEHGPNPPGIFVNSQSQSDHAHSHSSGDRSAPIDIRRGGRVMRERMPTTLVVGTPSTVSEGSQPEKGSDMSLSQLARDGQALLQRSSPEQWTHTQSIAGTQLLTQILATQEVLEPTQDLGVTQDAHEVGMELEDGTDEYPLMGPPQISPRKQKGYSESPKKPKGNSLSPSKRKTSQDPSQTQKGFWSSSSGTSSSIPGLSMNVKEDVFMATTKSSGAGGRDKNSISQPQYSGSRGPRNQNVSPTKPNILDLLSRPSPSKVSSAPTKSPIKQAGTANGTGARSTRPPNLLRSSRPQDNNIPAIPPQDIQVFTTSRFFPTMSEPSKPPPTTTATSKKPVKANTVPLKKNPITRRKSPAPIDRHLFEATPPDPEPVQEADNRSAFERRFMEGSGLARDETLLVEDETQPVQQPPPTILSETPLRMDVTHATKKTESIHSEADESVVMDTDGEGVELLETLPLDDSRHRGYDVPIHALTESPKEIQQEMQPEKSEKPVVLSGKTLVPSKGGSEARPASVHRSSSKGSKGSKSDAANSKKARSTDSRKSKRTRNKHYNGSSDSSEHDDTGDYKPGESQSHDQQASTTRRNGGLTTAVESFRNEDSDPEVLFRRPPVETSSTSRKRSAKSQNGPSNAKRRRMHSPMAESAVEMTTSKSRSNQKANEEPTLSTAAKSKPVLAPSQTSGNEFVSTRRNTRNRGMSNTRAIITAQIGHLVLARSSENKTYYPGYAVERARRMWQIEPLQPGPAMFVEPKNMRRCTFKPDDLVTVAPGADEGEDCGDAIVIAVDERWDEERTVLVRIGGEGGEQRYVHVRYLSVVEKHIKKVWDDRKLTHDDLKKDDGAESVVPSAAPLSRANSMAIPTPAKTLTTSFNRSPQAYPSYFKGFGFILTNCDQSTTKHLMEAGGYVYDSWLSAYKFDGGLEKVDRKGTAERWIRKQPGASGGRGRSKSTEAPALQWIGNRDEQNVKALFVVAGGDVKLTSKTLIGLAFGVPYVSSKWIEDCHKAGNRVNWQLYLLPSHNLPNPLSIIPNMLPTQLPDPRWGFPDSDNPLDEILTHGPLLHRRILLDKPRVLYIAPDCIEKLKQDGEEHDSPACNVPFVYCCLAMGAQHVEAVDEHVHATDTTLSKYDLIIVADQLLDSTRRHDKGYRNLERLLENARERHTMVIDQSDIKMSIACGTLLTIPSSP